MVSSSASPAALSLRAILVAMLAGPVPVVAVVSVTLTAASSDMNEAVLACIV